MVTRAASFQERRGLSVVQLISSNQNTFDYISGPEAIKKNFIDVKEIDQSGSVNNLSVFNNSEFFVFFMDGDILSGAKQNRVLNTSILLMPQTKTTIPVSCVEAGRWGYKSEKFGSTEYTAPVNLRSNKASAVNKNLKEHQNYYSDQTEVWNDVHLYSEGLKVHSATSNLSDEFDRKMEDFEKIIKDFRLDENANGAAFFINDKLSHIDMFGRTDIYAEYFPKMLKGAAMEVVKLEKAEHTMTMDEAIFKTLTFLDKFDEMQFETHKSIGAGEEKRFETNEFTGFELDYENNLIHLAALRLNAPFSRYRVNF